MEKLKNKKQKILKETGYHAKTIMKVRVYITEYLGYE